MPININGNVINRFGDRLPVPYLDNITIYNNELHLRLSIYFENIVNEESSTFFSEYLESMSQLNYVIQIIMDGKLSETSDIYIPAATDDATPYYDKYGPIAFDSEKTSLFTNLLSGDVNILQTVVADNTSYASGDVVEEENYLTNHLLAYQGVSYVSLDSSTTLAGVLRPNNSNILQTAPLSLTSDFTEELVYAKDGTPVHKFSKEFVIKSARDRTAGFDTIETLISAMSQGLDTALICYTTSLGDGILTLTRDDKTEIQDNTGAGNIIKAQVSDMSYEIVSKNGKVGSSKTTIFKTVAGDHYDEQPLQAIDSIYYGNTSITNMDIVNAFTELIEVTTNEPLQDKFDNLAFVLAVYGSNVDILPKLNEFRKTFSETSTMTPVGRFHERVELLLYNTNNEVKRATQLRKFLNISPVVVDARRRFSRTYTPPVYDPGHSLQYPSKYIYVRNSKLGSYAMPGNFEAATDSDLMSTYEALAENDEIMNELTEISLRTAQFDYERMLDKADEWLESWYGGDIFSATIKSSYYNSVWMHDGKYNNDSNASSKERVLEREMGFWDGADINLDDRNTYYMREGPQIGKVGTKNSFKQYEWFAMHGEVQRDDESGFWNSKKETITWTPDEDLFPALTFEVDIFREPAYFTQDSSGYVSYNNTATPDEIFDGRRPITRDYQSVALGVVVFAAGRDEYTVDVYDRAMQAAEDNNTGTMGISYYIKNPEKVLFYYDMFKKHYLIYLRAAYDAAAAAQGKHAALAAMSLAGDVNYLDYNMYMSGYVFFDYEKSIGTLSALSKIFEVPKIESFFGTQITHTMFRLNHTQVKKLYDLNNYGEFGEPVRYETGFLPEPGNVLTNGEEYPYYWNGTITTSFDSSRGGAISPPTNVLIRTNNETDGVFDAFGSGLGTYVYQKNIQGGQSLVSTHFIPRNFQFTQTGSNDYRLACFELQEAVGPMIPKEESASEAAYSDYGEDSMMTAWQAPSMYVLSFNMNDQTKEIYSQLVDTFQKTLEQDLQEYYEAATEECNYNIDDGTFNKFFIDSMMAEFEDTPDQAPWYKVPAVFHLHADLINNTYGGVEESIMAAAREDAELLHPKTGNIYTIEAFKTKMADLYSNYTDGGLVYQQALTVGNKNNLIIGDLPDSGMAHEQAPGYSATIRNLPQPTNLMMSGFADALAMGSDAAAGGSTGGYVQIDTEELE